MQMQESPQRKHFFWTNFRIQGQIQRKNMIARRGAQTFCCCGLFSVLYHGLEGKNARRYRRHNVALKNPRVNKAKSIIAISGFVGFVTRSVGCSPSNQWSRVWPCSSISYSNPKGSFVHVIGKKTRTDSINTVTKTINFHILPFYVPNSSISNVNSPKLKQNKAKKRT